MTTETEVGKADLCIALKWSRPTLDARLKKDPNFPVLQVGGRGGGWKFDLVAVRHYLSGGAAPAPMAAPVQVKPMIKARPAAGDELDLEPAEAPPYIPPQTPAMHQGEATATQRLKLAQAAIQEDKLARQRGELVEAADMRDVLATIFAELKSGLTELPTLIVKKHDLSERVGEDMQHTVENMMRKMAQRIRAHLSDA